ncbi:RusA family crossover junction endodeoxyribonuclease [Dyella silvatica]|uniref:RusA family crossover junction endodeoxyribonuclease n=1 Tax=Dyella silvatica TaxID=2992128 RepID=UPI00225152BE|nr:RusA family crossover junction endodeoxyribonuclease [Dyella silvatica]
MKAMRLTQGTTISDPALSGLIERAKGAAHVASLVFPFEPVPASRPRVTRWGVFYAKTYRTWKQLAEKHCAPGTLNMTKTTPLFVVVESIFTKARTSKLTFPTPDVDNTAKGPLDVITKASGYWHDDKQVTWLVTGKRFAVKGEDARTEIHIYTLP